MMNERTTNATTWLLIFLVFAVVVWYLLDTGWNSDIWQTAVRQTQTKAAQETEKTKSADIKVGAAIIKVKEKRSETDAKVEAAKQKARESVDSLDADGVVRGLRDELAIIRQSGD